MALLSWDQIVASTDFPTEYVDVPEWGDGAQVRVRGLSMKDRNDWQRLQMKSVEDDTSAPDADAHLVALAMINADGGRVCKDPAQQSDEIAALRSDIVSRLSRKVMDLSGLGEDDAKDAEKTPRRSRPPIRIRTRPAIRATLRRARASAQFGRVHVLEGAGTDPLRRSPPTGGTGVADACCRWLSSVATYRR